MLAIAIHGGAGVIAPEHLSANQGAAYRLGITTAIDAGYRALEAGSSSLDAVVIAVRSLEDNPLFNAGCGAVLNHDGEAVHEASIMDGRNLRAGAVAGLRHIRNPIDLARCVMECSEHVLLYGQGAENFATQQGIAYVPNKYFITEHRQKQLTRILSGDTKYKHEITGLGTVGAVAVDQHGNLAAATSTGGMVNKKWSRIGDSPIIGAGTYADNASCAVSATGHGEYFIRSVVAYDICAMMQYTGCSLEEAAQEIIQVKLKKRGGEGGIIAVDVQGNIVMEFNSIGMFRGMRNARGQQYSAIYSE
ncbi:MAG: isoaspartyl peptidase/L-asparaginase [Gammaproteobacteria bacterium]|nr:isoaspartyl peptidase/L-asparaginase [Gammaproteobacteria bacterium]